MADKVPVELTSEEWGQVMIVLQGGIYRVVAPLLQSISDQIRIHMTTKMAADQQAAAVIAAGPGGPRLVEAEVVPDSLPAAE